MSLPVASLIGAVYVAAALAVLLYVLPVTWAQYVTPAVGGNILDWVLWILAIGGTVMVLAWFGNKLAGDNPPRGLRGGVFLMLVAAVGIFFIARAVAMIDDSVIGQAIAAAVTLGLIYAAVRFFIGRTGTRWMIAIEEQGWFSSASYKRSLGVKVRRLTILGILIIGGTGAYSLSNQGLLPARWTLSMPFQMSPITVMYGADTAILLLLACFTLWVAWRAVNVPTFSEFLIATEAEMNKVSWSSRKRLFQDTIVVLITTLLMTLFLLVVDLFWGWLLSRQTVGVLPARATTPEKGAKAQESKW